MISIVKSKIYFVYFIFVVCANHKNIFTTKISRCRVIWKVFVFCNHCIIGLVPEKGAKMQHHNSFSCTWFIPFFQCELAVTYNYIIIIVYANNSAGQYQYVLSFSSFTFVADCWRPDRGPSKWNEDDERDHQWHNCCKSGKAIYTKCIFLAWSTCLSYLTYTVRCSLIYTMCTQYLHYSSLAV